MRDDEERETETVAACPPAAGAHPARFNGESTTDAWDTVRDEAALRASRTATTYSGGPA